MIKVDIKSQTDKYLEIDGVLFFMGYHAPFFFLTLTSDSTSVAYVLLSDNPSSPVSHPQLDSAPTAPSLLCPLTIISSTTPTILTHCRCHTFIVLCRRRPPLSRR
jgi:hypothetical protein